ncbi:hypothetical protein ABB37_07595 [Leptomonas pyrrhocoris]|uniref:Uncharacterized protein n=1 Tax=Leptomonas pyrrhocoris TaxID=157538 RepID=A0A0N0VE13_LEPPY|nr:hypothetical protein ABB37_07595 [Leptomonas pyrrhocoris]XP_015655213.1 hypothetical protein ABB37_07595 [Leptomonas pyrrhocoris]KPA76773.1 hypothetical protein ABB37_07595 [Leptomonas pyrrhocoris]KPA76774.1 hypothetical protein ABB37_07595 [Leptomonas pyrrhocoris]|eukprot:XP_015655212.1 hypothetical protein ABB37_07595 [Leptomonas pyrrhocoris]
MSSVGMLDYSPGEGPRPASSPTCNTALRPHPPKGDSNVDISPARPHTVSSASSAGVPAEKAKKKKRVNCNVQPFNSCRSAEEELAALREKISAWKEKRLAEVQEELKLKGTTGVAQVEAAMESRIQQRRAAERERAGQRLGQLLDTLGPRMEQCIQRVSASSCAESDQESEPIEVARDEPAVAALPTKAPLPPDSPPPQALVACERQHLIGYLQLSVEERDARNSIKEYHQFVKEVSQLVADEEEFRCSFKEWEDSWYKRLVETAASNTAVE